MIYNGNWTLVWNHTCDFKIKLNLCTHWIWNHKYHFRPKLHDSKFSGEFPLWDVPARNHSHCIHQNKYPIQGDDDNYHNSLQALLEGIGHYHSIKLQFHHLNLGFGENHFMDPVDNLVKKAELNFNIPFSMPNRMTLMSCDKNSF